MLEGVREEQGVGRAGSEREAPVEVRREDPAPRRPRRRERPPVPVRADRAGTEERQEPSLGAAEVEPDPLGEEREDPPRERRRDRPWPAQSGCPQRRKSASYWPSIVRRSILLKNDERLMWQASQFRSRSQGGR